MKREHVVLLLAVLVSMVAAEFFVRAYYWHRDGLVARDENELCLKKIKLNHVPSSKVRIDPNSFEIRVGGRAGVVSGERNWTISIGFFETFLNFQRLGWFDNDVVVGQVPKKGFSMDEISVLAGKDGKKARVVYTEHHTNRQGLHNINEFSLERENARVRIAMFGDSFTCGNEVPFLLGMGSLLEMLVPESEVLNFCVSGTGIETMFARYVHEAKKFKPDVVVFNVFVDDIQRPFRCPLFAPRLKIINGRLVLDKREYGTFKEFDEKYQLPRFESYLVNHAWWVYNQYTGYSRRMTQGIALFDVMLDEMARQTRESNSSFFVTLIADPNQGENNEVYYAELVELLERKKVSFFDSRMYFDGKRKVYSNQSFYYNKRKDSIGHYNVIGNALHAQGVKMLLEGVGIIESRPNYNFVQFSPADVLYVVPERSEEGDKMYVRTIVPFEIREANYSNLVWDDEVRRIGQYVSEEVEMLNRNG